MSTTTVLPFFLFKSSLRWFVPALALLLFAGCSEKTKPLGRNASLGVAPVRIGHAQRKAVPLTFEAIGAVEPIHTASVRSQVTGTFMKIGFQESQEVKQGDLLFEIDPRPFRNAVNAAEADLQKVRVQLENARAQVARYKALNVGSMISNEQYQVIVLAERTLTAQLASSESALANAKLQLDYCSIRAPLSGRTGGLGAHEGDLVRASDATVSLVTINQLSPIYVTFGVPQQLLATLGRYRTAGAIVAAATPIGAEGPPEMGELTFVDNLVDPATGTLKLKATFPNATHRLWPGQFVSVQVTLATPDALVVPSAAVQADQKGHHVFVVKSDKTAEMRSVTIERTHENDSIVAKGLAEGETVVIDGQLRVVPGKPVEIKEAAAAAATDAPVKTKKQRKAS